MAKRRKREQEEKSGGVRLSLKEYQKALGRADDPDVAEKLSKIYTTSERVRTSKLAQSIAKQASKGYVRTGLASSKRSAVEKRVSAIARKAISLVSPQGSVVSAITKSGKSSRGRGRPPGTYKVRYLPSGRAVKVPTHIYKKMLSAEKSQMRLMRAQQLAHTQAQADQVAMQTDARYQQGGSDEQFLAESDQAHEMEVLRAKQQAELSQMPQELPQGPGVGSKIIKGFGDFGRGLSRLGGARRPQMVDKFGRPVEQPQQLQRVPGPDRMPREPRVTALSEKANLLTTPNEFNNPGQSTILWNKKRRL